MRQNRIERRDLCESDLSESTCNVRGRKAVVSCNSLVDDSSHSLPCTASWTSGCKPWQWTVPDIRVHRTWTVCDIEKRSQCNAIPLAT